MARTGPTKKETNEKALLEFLKAKGGKATRKQIDTELGKGFGPLVYSLIKKNLVEKIADVTPTEFKIK